MAARLPRLIAVVVLAAPAAVPAQTPDPALDTLTESQVITGEMLRRAGATRLSDVLRTAQRWDVETVDGSVWSASALGGGPFLPARWTVLVNGQRVDDDLFGVTDLDRLGVPLEQVSSVELIELPRLVAGTLTSDGLIHIMTADPPEGPSAGGWFVTGSEIGDPGPFAFTPGATSNVDRLGHSAAAEMGYAGKAWFASAAVAWARTVPTDRAILERYRAALGPVPRLRSTAPALRIGGRLGGGWHEAALRHSHVDGALGLSPFGTEIATDERFTVAGAVGELPLSPGRRLLYDISHTRNQIRLRPGRPGPPLDWLAGTSELRVELARTGATLQLAGLRLRRRAVSTPADLANPVLALATGYAQVRIGRGSGATAAGGSITVGEGDAGLAALLTREWTLARLTSLEAVLSYERISRGEDNGIWAWTERGYALLEESGADFDVVGAPRSPERMGADFRLTTRAVHGLTLSTRALLRRSRRLSLEHRELHFVPAISSFDGPAAIVHGAGGELAGGSVELTGRPVRGLTVRGSYWARGAVGGDGVFRDAWAAVPRQGARATVEYTPVAGLDLWMTGAYRGSTRHRELAQVEAESEGRYRASLGDVVTLDIAIQKRLWDGRLRAHFGIRNLLGADLRYHPAGATFGPTAIVQVEGAFP
jgi:hypothetical protein